MKFLEKKMSDGPANSLPQPGKPHELLKPFAGTFRTVVKLFTGDAEPIVTTGTMVSQFVVGGLYLQQEYQGDEVEGPFPSFEGRGVWGYNFATQQYEGFWIDNVSSIMQREDGAVDDEGKVWEMHSEIHHPQAGLMKKRSVITLIDDNHHEVAAFMTTENAPEFKSMELVYTRQ